MIRLSKRAWNNVLIFAMLGLILILNIDTFRSNQPSARLVVPEGEYIINLQINQVEIEKAGQIWRINASGVQPNIQPSSEQLADIIKAWQKAYISPAGVDFDSDLFSLPSSLVVISLAGVVKPTVVALNIVEEQLFIVIEKQVYILNSPAISQLLEPIVMVKQ